MELSVFEGKDFEILLEETLEAMKLSKKDIMFKKAERKGGLFKGTIFELHLITLEKVATFIIEYLKKLITDMGLEVTFESKIRDGQISIKMYSDNNPILIGKNGQTLSALQNIIKQVVSKEISMYPNVVLDVENYKDKQLKNIERLAKNIAREVIQTKIDAKMESMNSYERRIVHNALTNYKNIYTTSEGEEPHRHIIVKYKEETE